MKKRQMVLIIWIMALLMLACTLLYWLTEYYSAPVYTPMIIPAPTKQSARAAVENVEIPEHFEDMLYSENRVGWLNVPGVEIDEPVMQASDNEFYLTHNAFDEYDSFGACFALDSCNLNNFSELSRVIVLFGHSAGNTDKTGFSRLQKLKNSSFAAENRYIHLQLKDGRLTTWEIFAAGDYPVSYDYLKAEPNNDYFLWQLNEMKSHSFCTYDGVSVTENDNIIILSTCNGNENSRFIVCAVLVE